MSELAVVGNTGARAQIVSLQGAMQLAIENGDLPSAECPVKHYFAPNLYIREIFIPAGTAVVGKIHKHAHFNDISQGRVRVSTEFGFDYLEAPCRFTSLAGTKRAVYAETDVIWTTYHPTQETDIEKIEAEIIAKDYDELNLLSYTDIKGYIA